MIQFLWTKKSVPLLLWALLAMGLMSYGCDDSRTTETDLFEAAEVDYRQGNYPEALTGYQRFLERYPQSPLASTAETRLRTIHREVSSVMETGDSPRPSYHGFDGEQSSSPPSGKTDDESDKFPLAPLDE